MATDITVKARVPRADKELFMKKCKLTGTTASERIRWLIHHDIENDNTTIDRHTLSLIQDMYERVGFVKDALLITISSGSIEYGKLQQYCRDNNIPVLICDPNESVPSKENSNWTGLRVSL